MNSVYSPTSYRRYVDAWNHIGCRTTLMIVGCGKVKGERPAAAMDLYRGDLTRKRIQIAQDLRGGDGASHDGLPWLILSAEHGLVMPSRILDPYETTISTTDRAALVERVRLQLVGVGAEHGLTLIVEAGAAYLSILDDAAEGMDVRISAGRVTGMVGRAKQTGRKILDWHNDIRRTA
jgi:hypothetical protein